MRMEKGRAPTKMINCVKMTQYRRRTTWKWTQKNADREKWKEKNADKEKWKWKENNADREKWK